jgi:hypothetical protein
VDQACRQPFGQQISAISYLTSVLTDTINAFKTYRKTVIDGCRPLIAPHFNLTVEIPSKRKHRAFPQESGPMPLGSDYSMLDADQ